MTLKSWLLVLLQCAGITAGYAESSVPVGVTTARTAVITDEVALHGSLVARRVSRLSSETDGLVVEIRVDDGDIIDRGDVVVRLNDRLAAIASNAAAARLEEARARHLEAIRQHAELARLRETQHMAATAVAAAAAQIDIDSALIKQAEAELERTREIVSQHIVHAPFAAVVRSKLVEQGEWVETNTALAELVEVDVLRLDVSVPQFYYGAVAEGAAVEVRLDALPDHVFNGQVTRKVAVSDTASRTFRVRIDIPNGERRLTPGMSARVVLKLGDQKQQPVLVVPRDAVVRKPDGSVNAWVIETADGVTKAVPRPITIGRSYREVVEIVSGNIVAGEQVVVRGNEILRPGQSVLVAEERPQEL